MATKDGGAVTRVNTTLRGAVAAIAAATATDFGATGRGCGGGKGCTAGLYRLDRFLAASGPVGARPPGNNNSALAMENIDLFYSCK